MEIQDKDVLSAECFKNGALFRVEVDMLIDQQDDDGIAIIWLSVDEVKKLLHSVENGEGGYEHSASEIDPDDFYRFNPSAQESVTDMQYTVFLIVDEIQNDKVFLSKAQLGKMANHYSALKEQWRKSEEWDRALNKFADENGDICFGRFAQCCETNQAFSLNNGTAECIGCGCTDDRACTKSGSPCHWLAVNYEAGKGVCSECPEYLDEFNNAAEHRA